MASIVQCVLLIFVIAIHLTTTANEKVFNFFEDGNCDLPQRTIGSTFKRTEGCKFLHITKVNISEPSKELFESLADGLESLRMYKCIVSAVYVPPSVTYFSFVGTSEYLTNIVIDEQTTYKVQRILLDDLPQLPANIDKLRGLKVFESIRIYGEGINLTIFNTMVQLENIIINKCVGVIMSNDLEVPSLESINIHSSEVTFYNDTFCHLTKLKSLTIENSNLLVIPECFYTLTNLTHISISGNKLRHIALDAFAQMNELEVLALSGNQISKITTAHQVKLLRLRKLFLGSNSLSELDVTSWFMPALDSLTLDGNQLKQVAGLPELIGEQLSYIDLNGNFWDCEWLSVTVQKIPGMQIFNNGSCYAYQTTKKFF